MRVRITFQVKNKGTAIPFHHQYLIAQIFKELIASGNHKDFLDNPFYSFSSLKGQTRVSKQGLHFQSSRVTIVFTSPDEEFVDFVIGKIFEQHQIEISTLVVIPETVHHEEDVKLVEEQKLICLSPLVVTTATPDSPAGAQFVNPASDDFSDQLFESTMKRMEEAGIDVDAIPNIHKFQLVPDMAYIEKVKAAQKKFAWVYPMFEQEIKNEVRGYTFPFTLYAPVEVQQFLFSCGLGLYTQKGFGMLDIANADQHRKIVPYTVRELVVAS